MVKPSHSNKPELTFCSDVESDSICYKTVFGCISHLSEYKMAFFMKIHIQNMCKVIDGFIMFQMINQEKVLISYSGKYGTYAL
jgi:hypothetical protein